MAGPENGDVAPTRVEKGGENVETKTPWTVDASVAAVAEIKPPEQRPGFNTSDSAISARMKQLGNGVTSIGIADMGKTVVEGAADGQDGSTDEMNGAHRKEGNKEGQKPGNKEGTKADQKDKDTKPGGPAVDAETEPGVITPKPPGQDSGERPAVITPGDKVESGKNPANRGPNDKQFNNNAQAKAESAVEEADEDEVDKMLENNEYVPPGNKRDFADRVDGLAMDQITSDNKDGKNSVENERPDPYEHEGTVDQNYRESVDERVKKEKIDEAEKKEAQDLWNSLDKDTQEAIKKEVSDSMMAAIGKENSEIKDGPLTAKFKEDLAKRLEPMEKKREEINKEEFNKLPEVQKRRIYEDKIQKENPTSPSFQERLPNNQGPTNDQDWKKPLHSA